MSKMVFDDEELRCQVESFYLDAEKFLESTLRRGGQFPWDAVYSFVACFPHDICRDHNLGDFIDYLLEKLNKCDNPHVVSAVINLSAIKIKLNLRRRIACAKEILRHLQTQPELVNACDGVVYSILDMWDAIGNGHKCFMTLLAKYGVIRPAVSLTHKEVQEASNMLRTCLWRVATTDLWDTQNPLWKPTEEYIQTACRKFDITQYGIPGTKEAADFVRRCTILKVFHVICTPFQNPEKQKSVFDCLGLYFDAVTEPFVTIKELEDLIDIPQNSLALFDEQYIKTAMDTYRTEFPESDIRAPRPLLQLSICATRTQFIKNGTLPGVMSKMRLPNLIKNYISVS